MSDAGSAGLPLDGIRVIELGNAIVLPTAITPLAGMGADVIKVEAGIRPDQTRGGPQPENVRRTNAHNHSGHFQSMNRNKRGITLDLSTEKGRELLLQLVAVSDVVAENFTSRVLANLRLEYETLRERNPRIILLSSNGFGHSGPWQNYRAWGPNIESVDGLMLLTSYADGVPQRAGSGGLGVTYPDIGGAYFGTFAILAALERRERTGEGCWLELSHYEAGVATQPESILEYTMNGRTLQPAANRHPTRAPQGAYRCEGMDRWIAISVASNAQFGALARVLRRPSLASDERFATPEARRHSHDSLDTILDEATRSWDPWALERELQAAGVEATVVGTTRDVLFDQQLRHRGFFEMLPPPSDAPEIGHRPFFRAGWRMTRTPLPTSARGPDFGEHNDEVLSELLGLSASEIATLETEGIIARAPKDIISREPVDLAAGLASGRLREVDPDYRELIERHFIGEPALDR